MKEKLEILKKSQFYPVLVLGLICLLSGAALATANYFTAPLISQRQQELVQAAYMEVLPQADHFEPVTGYKTSGVLDAVRAENGAGWAFKVAAKGFEGDVPAVVGIDASGTIIGVKFLENNESPGFGQKLVDGSQEGLDFAQQFLGRSEPGKLGETVDGIAGATRSSTAATNAVNAALSCLDELNAGGPGE